jgi:hypothetical protein
MIPVTETGQGLDPWLFFWQKWTSVQNLIKICRVVSEMKREEILIGTPRFIHLSDERLQSM